MKTTTKICAIIALASMLIGCGVPFIDFAEKAPPPKRVTPAWSSNFSATQQKAVQGDAEAQYQLATMYENGEGTAKDYRQALRWHRQSAGQGFLPAKYELGVMIALGIGTVAQQEDGVIMLTKAANQGFDPYSTSCTAQYRGKTYVYAKCWGAR